MQILKYVLAGILTYALGSLNFAIIISRLTDKSDIRGKGSGNAGLTNALRVMGSKRAALVMLGDTAKGVLAVLLGRALVGESGALLAGVCVILGHMFPVYFGLKGGKGVMTTCAVMLALDWRQALIALALFALMVLLTRYVSLGSILAALTLPFTAWMFDKTDFLYMIAMILFAAGIVILHRANIKRLLQGTENKISFGKKA